ncbi:guanylate cyclase [Elysia marginata]|uniref:Guanylate cyclase n=1 Tax=Elysia marginata TaxID=1093978 RepID=A0AAV4IYC2_9GAST|nr:guanylate cyclase [Elysia marginata]
MIANDLQMTTGEFVFIVIDLFLSRREIFQPWSPNEKEWDIKVGEGNGTAKAIFDSVLLVTILPPDSTSFKVFSREEVSSFVLAFHDAVLLFVHALNETIMAGGSISGSVSIDANGDRDADYALYDLDPRDDEFKLVRIYPGTEQTFRGVDRREIHWPSLEKRLAPPPDIPECGFVGEKCKPDGMHAKTQG